MIDEELDRMLFKDLFSKPKDIIKLDTHCLILKISEKLKGQEKLLESMVNNPFPTNLNEGE